MEYRIGEAARSVGLSVEGLRFYERRGLVRPARRTVSGYRLYGQRQVDSLRFIRAAQEMGFSLREIRDLLTLRDGTGADESCRSMRGRLNHKLDTVRRRLELLREFERDLVACIERCDAQIDAGDAACCPVLEDLGSKLTMASRPRD